MVPTLECLGDPLMFAFTSSPVISFLSSVYMVLCHVSFCLRNFTDVLRTRV